ncbi:MAG: hypothetical protein JSU85_10360 [Candidatus Zixiibacteriota bacterium]|nr:MAG: hypothetical protein JSU85_10360 [candidate division Zixibacteria bacterium]
MGPILIFDKSALECLNPDEAVFMDLFYRTNITPLFYIETLADLEKHIRNGRTAEQIVGNLANKTPEIHSSPNTHHLSMISAEITGAENIPMKGLPILSGGQYKELNGQTGVVFQESAEAEAFQRWQNSQFIDIERLFAKSWRRYLQCTNFDEVSLFFGQLYDYRRKPKDFSDLKTLVDSLLDQSNQKRIFRFSLNLLGIPDDIQQITFDRWIEKGKPTLHDFSPYFRYVLSVELFFYLGIAANLISKDRLSNKIDFAYFYYLPFCMVFCSGDKLHKKISPYFLRENQTFVWAEDFKADLKMLDIYYSVFSEELKKQGLFKLAEKPPADTGFLVTRLWDKHLPGWREGLKVKKPLNEINTKSLINGIKKFEESATEIDPITNSHMGEIQSIMFHRKVRPRKGKWKLFSPDIEQAARDARSPSESAEEGEKREK